MIRMKKKLVIPLWIVVFFLLYKFFYPSYVNWDMLPEEINIGAQRTTERHDKWIVITTIQPPTPAVKLLSQIPNWKLVVVGDRSTPSDWSLPGVVYLGPTAQKALGYRTTRYLPYDSYTRKNIGYLYAIEHGAVYIYETDDDNYIENLDIFHQRATNKALVVKTDSHLFNPYPHFGQISMWPRGYPLDAIGLPTPREYDLCSVHTPAIQQGLVNGDPDVDAIFRMTRYYNIGEDTVKKNAERVKAKFDDGAPMVMLPLNVYAPYNSQNTFFTKRAFWSLLLFTSVSNRETDIYRAYWAQKLLWMSSNHIAYFAPHSVQKRNTWHSNVKDARDEYRLYTQIGSYIEYLQGWQCQQVFFFDCMTALTNDLITMGFLESRDAHVLDAWITDLAAMAYAPPLLSQPRRACYVTDEIVVSFYPWEQNTSLPHDRGLVFENKEIVRDFLSDTCGLSHQIHLQKAVNAAPKFDDVLLVISITDDPVIIPTLDALYRIHFPHVLYCGSERIPMHILHSWKVSYIISSEGADALHCLYLASGMHYHVTGYLHITQNTWLQFEHLHVGSKNKNQIWVTGGDLYILDDETINICKESKIQCTNLEKGIFETINKKFKQLDTKSSRLEEISKCLIKAGSDPTFKNNPVTASKEITFYLPQARVNVFHEVAQYFFQDSYAERYGFLAVIMMECMEHAPEYLHSASVKEMSTADHFDYVFPFFFQNLLSKDVLLKQIYCDYIEKH